MPTASQRVISVGTTSTPLVSASDKRRGLVFVCPAANRYTISLDIPAVLDQGMTLGTENDVYAMSWETHGNLVQRAWQAISAVAAQNVTFYEIFE